MGRGELNPFRDFSRKPAPACYSGERWIKYWNYTGIDTPIAQGQSPHFLGLYGIFHGLLYVFVLFCACVTDWRVG